MAQFNLDDYEPVDVRIKKFLSDHKDGRILTELIGDTERKVTFKACLYIGEILVSTGHAKEIVGKGFVNQTSALENSETSAIGRALADYGYSGDKRASKEEMQAVERSVNKSKAVPAAKTVTVANTTTKKLQKCPHCGTLGKYHAKDCPNYIGVPKDRVDTSIPKGEDLSLDEVLGSLPEFDKVGK